MKTFKKWYHDLSGTAQEKVKKMYWVDITKNDGFNHFDMFTDKFADTFREGCPIYKTRIDWALFHEQEDSNRRRLRCHDCNERGFIVLAALLNEYNKVKDMDDKTRDKFVLAFANVKREGTDFEDYCSYLPDIDTARQVAKLAYHNEYRDDDEQDIYDLDTFLLLTEDFDNLDITKLNPGYTFDAATIEIIGKDNALKILREHPNMLHINFDNINDPIFDELILGDNPLSEDQIRTIFRRNYCNNDSNTKLYWSDRFDDYLQRCVAADKKMLRYLPSVIGNYIYELTAKINEKKSFSALIEEFGHVNSDGVKELSDEERENIPTKYLYKYSKELRDIFNLAFCCSKERLAKTRAKQIGDLASIVKLYNYNFVNIIDALYADDSATTTSVTI